ncbi:MAG: ParB/RepB/Spo0J family partition protein [Pseudomonadota bacterium]
MSKSELSSVRLVDPAKIDRNPENPRLIFREDELRSLEESIADQGILVPLTIYEEENGFVILDGERRWRSALKLGLTSVPAIIQPKPDEVTNIMMMFAIHKARSDWDPLPTAMKLEKLSEILSRRLGRPAKEAEIAAAASLKRGEVRRYRNIIALPAKYKEMLLDELLKPRPQQKITVDLVLETTRGAKALWQRDVIEEDEQWPLVDAIIEKYVAGVITSSVDPRKLARIARALDRGELPLKIARRVVRNLLKKPRYSIQKAFEDSVERIDFEHGTEQLVDRIINRIEEHMANDYELGEGLEERLEALLKSVRRLKNANN